MKARTRFLNSVIEAAAYEAAVFPWTRGSARRASIARRRAGAVRRKSA